MSTRATTARHVRQRKLNTKQGLRIIREAELEDGIDDEAQRHFPQVETGVEKGEEIEYHLQAVINAANAAALGAKAQKQSYIPTPDAVKAKGVKYDDLYPKVFSLPSTYIRFSSTVEDSVGVQYCMDDDDVDFLTNKLNDGKDVNGQQRKEKLGQCSEDTFEEVMNFFEETSARLQPFANVDNAPIEPLEEMEKSADESLSVDAQKFLKPIYQYWASRKSGRPLMPSIKVRVLDTSADADDADPYVCFRRREVRQTRKTRGRDAQITEKLKKMRLELEQARQLLTLVRDREKLNAEDITISRKVFSERAKLKEVKCSKNIVGEKGEDEELLVNQKPAPKPKARQSTDQNRPQTLRLRANPERSAPENDLVQLADLQAEVESQVQHTIEARKEQHRRWNQQWVDATWGPLTPPLDDADEEPKWAPLFAEGTSYPTPPPTLPSEGSQEREDVEMKDQPPPVEKDTTAGATPEPDFVFHIPGAYPMSEDEYEPVKRDAAPVCRLRYGRGGRCFLEARRKRKHAYISRGVVSDSDSDEEDEQYFEVKEDKVFDYRVWLNSRSTRPEDQQARGHQQRPSGDQSAMMHGGHPPGLAPQASAGSNG